MSFFGLRKTSSSTPNGKRNINLFKLEKDNSSFKKFKSELNEIDWSEDIIEPFHENETKDSLFNFDETDDDLYGKIEIEENKKEKDFYGLPLKVKHMLEEERKIKNLYEWQTDLLKKLNSNDDNFVYCVPTSGGKTLVSEIMILKEILINKKNALFIFPFVSIVREKIRSLIPFALEFGFIIDEYANDKGTIPPKKRMKQNCLYIATIEKAHLLITCLLEEKRLDEIGLIVVDELHMLGDGTHRGCTLESFLILCCLSKKLDLFDSRLIAMSATLNNFDQLSRFLNAKIEKRDFRPVELVEYVKVNNKIYKHVNDEIMFKYDRTLSKASNPNDPDNLTELVEEKAPNSPILIFCPTKISCENIVNLLTNTLPKTFSNFKKSEKKNVLKELQENNTGQICSVLKKGIPYGIAYHHSGLTSEEREIIESSFINGTLCCIVCTSTLAAGVNLPAQRVIIRAPYVATNLISSSQYKQMSGRAGRAGFCTEPGESILMVKEIDLEKIKTVFNHHENECISSIFYNKNVGIPRIILSLIHTNLAKTIRILKDIFKNQTLYGIQFGMNEDFDQILEENIEKFIKTGLIEKPINEDEKICITKLGKGVVKGLIDIDRSKQLYSDLKKVSQAISVNSCFHLLFVCTYIFDSDELPTYPNSNYLYEGFFKLNEDEKIAANLMGIREYEITKYHLNLMANEKIRRFFLTLLIYEAWKGEKLTNLSVKCKIQRGTLQTLFNRFSTNSLSLLRFIEELNEFSGLKKLLSNMCSELSLCSNPDLLPLLQLPHVKNSRAKQLYNAGFKNLEDIAKSNSAQIQKSLDKISFKACSEIIKFAKQFFIDRADVLQAETEYYINLAKS